MDERYYDTQELARRIATYGGEVEVARNRIRNLTTIGVLRPRERPGVGRARLFSLSEAILAGIANALVEAGVVVERVREIVDALREMHRPPAAYRDYDEKTRAAYEHEWKRGGRTLPEVLEPVLSGKTTHAVLEVSVSSEGWNSIRFIFGDRGHVRELGGATVTIPLWHLAGLGEGK